MEIRAGSRLKSTVCSTEVIAVKAPDGEIDVRCGGVTMSDPSSPNMGNGAPLEEADGGSLMGKRYVSSDETLELLCTKPGAGSLSLGDSLLTIKESKPLPASD
ncbi:MAG: hypothetical protein P8J01_04175 [Acidimicrobiales bacterium]|nr:hypothetical protein [Acidimicrobiales bacterium]MDG1845572.1 hypothetical protein [Acidimicrobiales bacterium]